MKNLVVFILSFYSISIFSQNLVPNPGFDDISRCPHLPDSIRLAPPWTTASLGTPDLLHTCSDNPYLKIPDAGRYFDSYQEARSGNGYGGIFVYGEESLVGNGEYMQSPLIEPLQKGSQYFVRFYAAPDISHQSLQIYTDAIGLAFKDSLTIDSISGTEVLPYQPIIENTSGILNERGWVEISGCYEANGTEKVLVIGNFRTISETQVEKESNNLFQNLNYFFIEDVYVYKFDPLPDTILICDNGSAALDASFMNSDYFWSTGDQIPIITVNEEGIYTVDVTISGCVFRDTVLVINPFNLESPIFLEACEGDELSIFANAPGFNIWDNGQTNKSRTIKESGNYVYYTENECGKYNYEFEVNFEECKCNYYIPNIFSPNNDGNNDIIDLEFFCEYPFEFTSFEIFDRLGNKVYFANLLENVEFNGRLDGKDLLTGVYIWKIKYTLNRDGKMENKMDWGDITLIR